jgi:hypothetical protein
MASGLKFKINDENKDSTEKQTSIIKIETSVPKRILFQDKKNSDPSLKVNGPEKDSNNKSGSRKKAGKSICCSGKCSYCHLDNE